MLKRVLLSGLFMGALVFPAAAAECGDPQAGAAERIVGCTEELNQAREAAERADLLVTRATQLRVLGNLDEALVDVSDALGLVPDHVEGLFEQGRIFHIRGDWELALDAYGEALALEPERWQGVLNRLDVLANLGRSDDCLAESPRAIEIAPEQARSWAYRGRCYFIAGLNDEAIADYEKAVEIGLDQPFLHDNLAAAYLQAERYEDALAAAQYAAELDSSYEGAHYSIVEALVGLGRFDEAVTAYHVGEVARTSDELGHGNSLAWLLYIAGEHERALPIIEEVLARHPVLTSDHVYEADTYAHLLAALGHEDRSVETFLLAAELGGEEKASTYRESLTQLGISIGPGSDGLEEALRECVVKRHLCQLDH